MISSAGRLCQDNTTVQTMPGLTRRIEADSGQDGKRSHLGLAVAASLTLALWLLVGLLLVPCGATVPQAEAFDAPGTVRIQPAEATVDVGRTVTVEVRLEDVGNSYGLDIRLAFDPALVQVPSGRVTPRWDLLHSLNHFVIKNEANNISGTVWYAVTNIHPAEPFTGTGRVCAIAFTGVASGTTPLHFTYAKGSTREGAGMWPATADGTITVQSPAQHLVHLPVVVRSAVGP